MGLIENISQDVFAFFCTDMCVFAKIRYSQYNANTVCVGVVGVGLIENTLPRWAVGGN